MPVKEWIIPLSEEARILVFIETAGPLVLSFAVILIAWVEGEKVCVTRFDTAHGQAHRDVLGRSKGLIEKDWLLDLTKNEALQYSIDDLKENYGDYIQFFRSH